ncbi:MAG TPA: hypothetical protein VNK04_17055 [Gemmataceae bacterium]|nr:hypothetical protein [Gemmataceae bacterium]
MARKLPLVVALAFPLVLSGYLMGDDPKQQIATPDTVARNALDALKEDRLEDFAKAMHPDALKRFKALLLSIVDAAAKDGQEKQILVLFSGVRTADDLKKLDETQFFVAFYRGVTRLRPEMKQLLGGAEVQTLGYVMEGKDTAHVVYRMTVSAEGAKVTKLDVLSLQKTGTGWGMLLSGDIEGIANLLKQKKQ